MILCGCPSGWTNPAETGPYTYDKESVTPSQADEKIISSFCLPLIALKL